MFQRKKTVFEFLGINCSLSSDVKTESTVVTTLSTQLTDTSTEATTEATTETTTEDRDEDDPEAIITPASDTDWFILSLIILCVGIPILMITLIIVIWFVVSNKAEPEKKEKSETQTPKT